MSEYNKNLQTLNILKNCCTRTRNKVLKNSNNSLIKLLSECVCNTLNGSIKLRPKDKRHLKTYKNTLRKLSKTKSLKGKRQILIQKGGFLQYILPSAIAIITSLIQRYINNKK